MDKEYGVSHTRKIKSSGNKKKSTKNTENIPALTSILM